jgi:hypothetical protein
MLPAIRPTPQENPQVSRSCAVLEPYTLHSVAEALDRLGLTAEAEKARREADATASIAARLKDLL